MKIDKRHPTVRGGKTVSTTQGIAASKDTRASKIGNVDKLQIAATTSQLQGLEAQLAKLDITDAAKVAAVKLAVNSGTFKVDSEVVADRLIDTAKESVRKRPQKN